MLNEEAFGIVRTICFEPYAMFLDTFSVDPFSSHYVGDNNSLEHTQLTLKPFGRML